MPEIFMRPLGSMDLVFLTVDENGFLITASDEENFYQIEARVEDGKLVLVRDRVESP